MTASNDLLMGNKENLLPNSVTIVTTKMMSSTLCRIYDVNYSEPKGNLPLRCSQPGRRQEVIFGEAAVSVDTEREEIKHDINVQCK